MINRIQCYEAAYDFAVKNWGIMPPLNELRSQYLKLSEEEYIDKINQKAGVMASVEATIRFAKEINVEKKRTPEEIAKLFVDCAIYVHNSWEEDNFANKFLDPNREDRQWQFTPSEYIGWEELDKDMGFVRNCLEQLGFKYVELEAKMQYFDIMKTPEKIKKHPEEFKTVLTVAIHELDAYAKQLLNINTKLAILEQSLEYFKTEEASKSTRESIKALKLLQKKITKDSLVSDKTIDTIVEKTAKSLEKAIKELEETRENLTKMYADLPLKDQGGPRGKKLLATLEKTDIYITKLENKLHPVDKGIQTETDIVK